MAEPENHTLALLREMRTDMDRRHSEITAEFAAIREQLDKMQANGLEAMKRFIGHRTMVERTVASFEADLSDLKQRMSALEAARS
ncbi:hypothetical protein [Enterovirga aerilata]|uniref:Uncharacterized protein n=1 Tax=Enterovirga aerilata TaxID=2730920 RepID=A0A849I4F0_9HYPH|nr:hypothetical protein [Enterovirga sp. DB1703]NNM71215.1 hypothetical protein [Enterovirga sp. DB1703]